VPPKPQQLTNLAKAPPGAKFINLFYLLFLTVVKYGVVNTIPGTYSRFTLLANIRLARNNYSVINALAYFLTSVGREKKGL